MPITPALLEYTVVLQTVKKVEKVEEEADVEEEVEEEESLGDVSGMEDDGDDDDKVTSVLSDILNYEGADMWGEMLVATNLV